MNFAWNARLPRNIQESFTCRKSTTWDRRLYFPSEGRRAEDLFALRNPTASARFEPANLGTEGQHATSRPPKPLKLPTLLKYTTHPTHLVEFYIWCHILLKLLLECIKYTHWWRPLKVWNTFEWRVALMNWWRSNIWVHMSVLISYCASSW